MKIEKTKELANKGGYIVKSDSKTSVPTKELELINKLTRRSFSEDEIYTFSVVLCDNDIDRDNDRFTDEALETLSELFIGKTGILDHDPKSQNQTARIYECHTEAVPDKKNILGKPYKRLVAKSYMPKSQKNENIILEIDSGIKKEVSVGCKVDKKTCSICGKNLNEEPCNHVKGRKYKKNGEYQLCHRVLELPTDAYEWSFVAVPAQRMAGVIKAFTPTQNGGETKMEDIIKSLNSGEEVTLSQKDASKLLDLIDNLKEKAKIGSCYKEDLKNEMLKLAAIVNPEINSQVMKSVAEKLNIDELKSFKNFFKSKLSEVIPIKPQFSSDPLQTQKTQNTQFKI